MQKTYTEEDLSKKVAAIPGLRFGYLGNFERWGDDRELCIWVEDLEDSVGNMMSIWGWPAKDFNNSAYHNAVCIINIFNKGWKAAKATKI